MLDQIIIRKGDFSFPKWLLFSNHGMEIPANDNGGGDALADMAGFLTEGDDNGRA